MTNQATIPTVATSRSAASSCRWGSLYHGRPTTGVAASSRLFASTVVAMCTQQEELNSVEISGPINGAGGYAPGVTRTRGQQFRKLQVSKTKPLPCFAY